MNSVMQFKSSKCLSQPLCETDEVSNRCKNEFDGVIDMPCFLVQLRLEQQRAQRSGSALSILLLTETNPTGKGYTGISQQLKTIKAIIRETDCVGYIDPYTVGVLLPYTSEEGAKKISEKILAGFRSPSFSITAFDLSRPDL